jgi:putative transcriptional regulator
VFRIREAVRRRMVKGDYQEGDVAAFRAAFRSVSQARFAEALGISVATLQNWEQGRRQPDGPAKALLRLLARHPRLLMHDLMPSRVVAG